MTDQPSRIERIGGRAIALRGDDVDTDRIIPARFLKTITFEGLGDHVFEDDRRQLAERGRVHPFDDPRHRGAQLLFVESNFGCGSSREHAPQAIARWGIRAIVGESFAEIFFGNALMMGLPCLCAERPALERLIQTAETRPDDEFVVDLKTSRITGGAIDEPLTLPEAVRAALLSGDWDATALLIDRGDEVEATAARLPYISGWNAS